MWSSPFPFAPCERMRTNHPSAVVIVLHALTLKRILHFVHGMYLSVLYCDVLPGNAPVICGFWIYFSDLLVIPHAELQLAITLSVSLWILLYAHCVNSSQVDSLFYRCAPCPNLLSCLRASCRVCYSLFVWNSLHNFRADHTQKTPPLLLKRVHQSLRSNGRYADRTENNNVTPSRRIHWRAVRCSATISKHWYFYRCLRYNVFTESLPINDLTTHVTALFSIW
jgi:hypothetical protein